MKWKKLTLLDWTTVKMLGEKLKILLILVENHTLCLASFLISSCNLFKICRFGLFFLAYCWSSITLLSELSCKTEYGYFIMLQLTSLILLRQTPKIRELCIPSLPSYCSLVHTFSAVNPSSSHVDEASARSFEKPVVCQPFYFYLVVTTIHQFRAGSVVLFTDSRAKCNSSSVSLKHTQDFIWQVHQRSSAVAAYVSTPAILTPASHSVLSTRHHIFTLLVFPGDHLKFNAGVSHSMVSTVKRGRAMSLYFCTLLLIQHWRHQ